MSDEKQSDDAVTAAQAVRDDLEQRRVSLLDHGRSLVAQRQEISFDAHTGSAAAKKKLEAIIGQITTHDQTILSVEAAIVEAQARVAAAQRAAATEADKAQALQLREAVQEFVECGIAIDEALQAIADESNAMREALNRIHVLGSQFPSHEMVNALGTNAVLTSLGQSLFKREFRVLAPRERRSMASLVRAWAANIQTNSIAPRLGEAVVTVSDEVAA
jgi:hypothetical protein